jgi:hypothetical protein
VIFEQLLRTQWRFTRFAVLTMAAVAFLLPTLLWRIVGAGGALAPLALMQGFETLGYVLVAVAFLGGLVLASQPWIVDAQTRHVYALSLPITWARYVALRFAAGLLTLTIPAIALYAGARLTLLSVRLPDVLRAYPGQLALRFLLGTAVSYALIFSLQYLAGRRAALVALLVILAVAGGLFSMSLFGTPAWAAQLGGALFEWPGSFAIYTAPWRLIDV